MGLLARAKPALSASLERVLGVSTHGVVQATALGYDGQPHHGYEASGWLSLPVALSGWRTGPGDVLADIGAGKGRVVVQASVLYRLDRVIGVERSPQLAAAARANVERLRAPMRAGKAEIIEADARAWRVPDDLTIAYLFNPFDAEIVRSVVDQLVASVDRRPRRLRIAYFFPDAHEHVLTSGRVRELPGPSDRWRVAGVDPTLFRRYEVVRA
jgi:hypothetical protein